MKFFEELSFSGRQNLFGLYLDKKIVFLAVVFVWAAKDNTQILFKYFLIAIAGLIVYKLEDTLALVTRSRLIFVFNIY